MTNTLWREIVYLASWKSEGQQETKQPGFIWK